MSSDMASSEKDKPANKSYDNNEVEEDHDNGVEASLGKLNIGPKKKLIVLGLGGFLCYRIFSYDTPNVPTSRPHDSAYGNHYVYRRSHCEEFMNFCFERFEVGIWASSTKYNLHKTLDCVMEGLKDELLFVWGQEECTNSGVGSIEKEAKPLFVKELNKIWEGNDSTTSSILLSDNKFTSSNTLLIDDKPYKSLLNPVHNAIFPEQYQLDVDDDALGPGSELRLYLDKLVYASDVPSFVRENPFGQMAITPEHCDWGYYSMIVRDFRKTTCGSEED